MKNYIPTARDRYKQLEIIQEQDIEYAPLQGYPLGYLMGQDITQPDRQFAFTGTGSLSWRTHEEYARFSYPIFTVVTTRLRLLVSAHKSIVPKKNYEDILNDEIQRYKQLHDEFKEDKTKEGKQIVQDSLEQLHKRLPFLKSDLSNLYNCFDRVRKDIRNKRSADITYLTNFLNKPNIHEDWAVVMTKTIWDYLVHLEAYINKIPTYGRALSGQGKYSEFVSVKAPTMKPIEGTHVLSLEGYMQQVSGAGYDGTVYFKPDEIMRFQYLPTNSYMFSLSPIEAIYRLLNEQLYYDKQRVEEFDLGKPPVGALTIDGKIARQTSSFDWQVKQMPEEQRARMENAINRRSKIDRIKVIQGIARSQYHSFLRSEAQSGGLQRQEQILDIAAKVYNMTPQEVNLIKDVNRSTASQQARSEALKGLRPHFQIFENEFYNDLFLPMGFGNYQLKFEDEVDESIWNRVDSMLKVMGENEVRRKVGMDEYPETEFDRPPEYRKEQIALGQIQEEESDEEANE